MFYAQVSYDYSCDAEPHMQMHTQKTIKEFATCLSSMWSRLQKQYQFEL